MRLGFKREQLELLAEQTDDPVAQENFDRIRQVIDRSLMLRFEGDHFEIEFTSAVTNRRIRHNLGFVPLDVWITNSIGAGNATINYAATTDEELVITTTGAVKIRFFAGVFVP